MIPCTLIASPPAGCLTRPQHCSGCIGFHVKAVRRLVCSRQELGEMLAVCIYMGGGTARMYTAKALAAWEVFALGQA